MYFSLSFFRSRSLLLISGSVALALTASAQIPAAPPSSPPDVLALDRVVVYGRAADLSGESVAASQGQVGHAEIAARPFLRRGELLEVVPGLVVTQHSGSGKANQYFLRGFNLDHGTDFAFSVDGMPVNLPSHAHGQGYADLNFIIPEVVEKITYQKGAYFAENGDFSAAGAAQVRLATQLAAGLAKAEFGEDNFHRAVVADSFGSARTGGVTTLAAEASHYDGPWTTPEDNRRVNVFARHAWTRGARESALTLMGYRGVWQSTDQVPLAAIEDGLIGRFDALDPTDGGDSDRASLSFETTRREADASTMLNAYVIRHRLDLYSNFTYFLDDPVDGDQFNQREDRLMIGGAATRTWTNRLGERELATTAGVQVRADFLEVALRKTAARELLSVVRDDEVNEATAGVFAKSVLRVNDWFRTEAGVRGDFYSFDVESDNPLNSGDRTAGIASPKLNLIFGPWKKTELYAGGGYGFHSNDARGTTLRVDPADGVTPADRVDPLARARSAELGVRTAAIRGLVSTLSLWMLELDSELVFVGDAGASEAKGATRRLGVELANFYQVTPWLALDADVALTRSRYREPEQANGGREVVGAIDTVITAGAVVDFASGWSGSLRARYFGPQPLVEDNSVTAPSSLTYNARIGWRGGKWSVALDVLNLFDRANNDIAYFYESQPRGYASAAEDIHLHPAEPRTVRASVTRSF